MSREAAIKRHVRALTSLDDAVRALKSLSAHHFRIARAELVSARAYRAELEAAVASVPAPRISSAGEPVLLVLGADLGLSGQYHTRIVAAARREVERLGAARLECVGRRTAAMLARAGAKPDAIYGAPTSVEEAPRALLEVTAQLFARFLEGRASSVDVLAARFGGVGEFEPVTTRLLPLDVPDGRGPEPSPYVPRAHLEEVAARERLFTVLYEIALEAMASEQGARLVATTAASEWLDREIDTGRAALRSLRREASTQEILEIVSGARRRRDVTSEPGPRSAR